MAAIETLRKAIAQVFAEWEKLPRLPGNWKIVSVMDSIQDRYVLQDVDIKEGRFESRTLAYVEIRDGKIWILTDNTDEGIGTALLVEGISKQDIVLAFYPPALREMGEFAVA